ncbi:hypothetical protein UB43_13745 [Pseudomonas sp. 21]|uniref:Ig-like domain-containing protein n=1 Tax=Pseudomonas sp. 21 TaxID=1619948 RepID=UPI0005EADDB5|nr:Ig-like domain-containing protein [Pseudomonas sp. 21]KJK00332.1 hypothetical protein UB43_13745 [Pseudomonas sp. 21]
MATEKVGIIAVTEDAAKKVVVKNGGKIKAHAGTKYLLQVDIETVAPENVTVKRVTESRHYDVDTTPPVAQLSIDKVTGDDIVNLDESKVPQIISGKATGEFQKGDIVSFTLNGHDYSAAVAADGKWSVTVAGADLAAATNIHATLVAHDTAGNPTDVVIDHGYQVILTPPQPSVYIDPVAGDGVINLAESQENQAITGGSSGGRAGDVISIVVNDVTYSTTIDANGKWSITVPGSELVADTDHHIDASFVATDIAGNTTTVTAGLDYDVDLIPPVATLEINVVAGDDIVNASEANTNQTISGKAGGEFLAGDLVTFTLNGTDYSAKVAADGTWSVQVSGTDLAKGSSIDATLVAHDAAGNSSTATANHPYTVDLLPPVAQLSIDPVTGDDIVNQAESTVPQVISGKATGEFLAGDIVSFKLNGTSYSAAVA